MSDQLYLIQQHKSKLFSKRFALDWVLLSLSFFLLPLSKVIAQKRASFTINTQNDRKAISPFIYGTNDVYQNAGSKRMGGNRLTSYNWENNASNAGRDWYHESDNYVPWQQSVPVNRYDSAGEAIKSFHQRSLSQHAYSLVTLPLIGHVARDKNGAVAESQSAPSSRWTSVEFRKPQDLLPFRLQPDLTDNAMYVDELLHYLLHNFGTSTTQTGIRGYSLDNEPGLWFDTHSRLWGHTPVSVRYLMERSIGLASLIKEMDPNAEVFGPASWGITEFENLQFAPDWDVERGNYPTFIDLYLGRMREKHLETGRRLLDVLDVHWYPQANNNGVSPYSNGTDYETNRIRMEMPRSLWDSTYIENTWIGDDPFKVQQFLPFLPKMNQHIDRYYPGTKLGITEYSYMGIGHASGGIAQADALGIFGKQGLYFANYWGGVIDYIKSGFDLYRNYNGLGGQFGNTSVESTTNDVVSTSVYASIQGDNDSLLHVIALNKNQDSAITVTITINSNKNYRGAKVWGFDNNSSAIRQFKNIRIINGNTFEYTIPSLTACHLVLSEEDISGYPDIDSVRISSSAGYSDGTASFELSVKVFDGNNDLQFVKANLGVVGGIDSTSLRPVQGSDGWYSLQFNVPVGVAGGLKTIPVYAQDATGRTAFANITYRVITKTQPMIIWEGDSIRRGTGNVYFDGADTIARTAYIRLDNEGGNQQPGNLHMHFRHATNRYNVMTWRLSNNDNPADAVNISDFGAIEFYIKSNANDLADIEVSLRDASAQLHTSSSVFLKRDGYISSFNKDRYTRVRIPLSRLTAGSEIHLDQIWQINFSSNQAREGFDVWVDDIRVIPYSHPVLQPIIDTVILDKDKGYANGNSTVTINARVNDPDNNLSEVTVDFSSIGGEGQQIMQLHEGIYNAQSLVTAGLSKGPKQIWVTATDTDGNSVSRQVQFTILEKATTEIIWDGDKRGSGTAVIVVDPSTLAIDSTQGNKGPIVLDAYMNMGTVGFSSVHWDWNEGTGDTAVKDLSTKGYLSFFIKAIDIKPGNDLQIFMKDRFGAFSSSVSLLRDRFLTSFNGNYQQVRIPMHLLLANGAMDARQVTRIGFLANGLDSNGIRFLVDDITAGGSNVADVRINLKDAACGNNGSIQVVSINGNDISAYQFRLNGESPKAGHLSVFDSLAPGIYELSISGPDQFEYLETIEIGGRLNELSAIIQYDNELLDLSVSGGSSHYRYQWSTGSQTQDISTNVPGVYTVVITDTVTSCSVTARYDLYPQNPNAVVTVTPAQCSANGTIQVSDVVGLSGTLEYYINGSANPAGINEPLFSQLTPGVYFVEVRGGANRSYSTSVQLGGNTSSPVINSNISYDNGKAFINLSVSGGTGYYRYEWGSSATTTNLWYLSDGIYEVTVTDLVTNCNTKAVYNIQIPTLQVVTQRPDCGKDGLIQVTSVTGMIPPFRYYINDQANPSGINSNSFVGLTPGMYKIAVRDTNDQSVTSSVMIENGLSQPVINANITYEQARGFINLTVSGGSGFYSYLWSSGSTYANMWFAPSGTYEVEVKDILSGCTSKAVFILDVPEMSLIKTDPNCGQPGSIRVEHVKGITGTLRYYINDQENPNGINSPIFMNLSEGNYAVKVVGDNNKSVNQSVYIASGIPSPQLNATITYENHRGNINLTVSGGSGIYSYLWTGGSTYGNLWGVLPGTYEVTVTDLYSKCVVKGSFLVEPTENETTAETFRSGIFIEKGHPITNDTNDQVLIYPNPVTKNGQVRLRFNFEKYAIKMAVITDASGARVGSYPVSSSKQREITIPIHGLKRGTYNITLLGRKQFTRQLIVID